MSYNYHGFFQPSFGPKVQQYPNQEEFFLKLSIAKKQLVQYSGRDFPIELISGDQPGIAVPGRVMIDVKLAWESLDILSFVLAHEWGHQVLGHTSKGFSDHEKQVIEDDADAYATQFALKHGYNLGEVFAFNWRLAPELASIRNAKIEQVYFQQVPSGGFALSA